MALSKNRKAPTAESPPPVRDPHTASTNIMSALPLHMCPNAHFTCDTKLYKLLEIICEAFYNLYICWCMQKGVDLHISDHLMPFKAMASTFKTASNEVKVGGYEAPTEYLQFMLSIIMPSM
ncbi:hypothetical protein L218DRAFT_1005333 [Marasmius fiardii PR-910]|nr:hypothetical protein L218DRAFT_1005333 [Marasmius fiardii PR-910]